MNVSLFAFCCCDNHLDQNNLEEDLGFIWFIFLCHNASLIEVETRIQAGTEAEIIRNDAYRLTHRLMVLIQSRPICLRMVLPTVGLVISYQCSVKTIPPRHATGQSDLVIHQVTLGYVKLTAGHLGNLTPYNFDIQIHLFKPQPFISCPQEHMFIS